jgi:hypothetical protein
MRNKNNTNGTPSSPAADHTAEDDGTGAATIPPALEYEYDESLSVPAEVIQLWIEVGNGIDKNQTGKSVD